MSTPITDYQRFLNKLLAIEALHAGATTEGERDAAARARERIQARLATTKRVEPEVPYKFSLPDPWTRKLFIALARRYGLRPYRRYRQHAQTIMLDVPARFVDETLWPEFQALSAELRRYLGEVTDRAIADALQADGSEPAEPKKGRQGSCSRADGPEPLAPATPGLGGPPPGCVPGARCREGPADRVRCPQHQ